MKPEPHSSIAEESADYELERELSLPQRALRLLRSWRGISLVVLVLGGGLIFFRGGVLYATMKEWRMHALVTDALKTQAEGKEDVAFSDLRRAYILTPGNLEVMRGIALYHGHRREAAALGAWQKVTETKGASLQDQVALCREALRMGELKMVRDQLWQWGQQIGEPKAEVVSIQAEIEAIDGHTDEAESMARVAAPRDAACQLSLARVLLLARGTDSEVLAKRREALGLLRELSLGKGEEMRDAVEILVRLTAQPSMTGLLKEMRLDEVVGSVAAVPGFPAALKVAAWDLRLVGRSERERETVMDEFAQAYHSTEQPGALEAARWLMRHREMDRVLKMAEPEMPRGESWFLVGMDALAGKGAWTEVLRHLDPSSHPPLAPAVRQLFTFRAQRELGQNPDPANVWRDLLAKLNGESSAVQFYVAAYAEQMGYAKHAAAIYRGMLAHTQTSEAMRDLAMERRNAYVGLLRTASSTMSLNELTEWYAGLVHEFPDMDEAQNDFRYLQLLQNKADKTVVAEVSSLLGHRPELLAVRSTLALALLREGHTQAAADVYSGWQIDWAGASDRCKAVRVAVLEAAGHHSEAEQIRSAVVAANLRVEEKQLAGLAGAKP